ncbi:hypothetical protein COV11_00820 [Candidatus Woesearchaeota archaeon CG10_big_fil_rev_8_21_14_0_10_30_7]|nr:MAG: hypothetical protein COV11_00820 [Candidatus Woesearchaeota archaeon CG10_big_fil_rev_8_21_14_0_10_30_7]
MKYLMKENNISKEIFNSLSPLEAQIIKALKMGKKYRVKDIYTLVKNKASKSSFSVLLDRLYKKGLVDRSVETAKGGVRFVYVLKQNKERFERNIVDSMIDKVIKKFGPKAIVYFDENLKKRHEK